MVLLWIISLVTQGGRMNPQTAFPTKYWHKLPDGRVQCDVCPRARKLHEGQRGLCYVRGCENQAVVLYSYGHSSGFCIDPIEKKPLNHFYPGSPVLSFGTAGCNLACKFCQNWDMSKSREMDTLSQSASPEALVSAAQQWQCRSIAFTYNDPVIFLEYAQDTADACHEAGLAAVAVTAAYICDAPRARFFKAMDAVNVDLKSFDREFYRKICGADRDSVLDTLKYIHKETAAWLEVTTLLIPGENDSDAELNALVQWYRDNLGTDVPWHFSAFHPDWKMQDHSPTPLKTLQIARQLALDAGIHYVYTGNRYDPEGQSTYCPGCGSCVIGRDQYEITRWALVGGSARCTSCQQVIPGCYDKSSPGHWGNHRQPVKIAG